MGERIERIRRRLDLVNRRLSPDPLHRLDRWLLLHRPLIWRSRVHWAAWWSFILCLGAAGVATWIASLPSTGKERFDVIGLSLASAPLSACLLWAVAVVRQPIGELSLAKHARLFVLNLATLCLLASPALTYFVTATGRIANSLPNKTFDRASSYHERHGFWACEITPPAAPDVRELKAMLEPLGFTSNAKFCKCYNYYEARSLCVWPVGEAPITAETDDGAASAALLLRPRLELIQRSKRVWARSLVTDPAVKVVAAALATLALLLSILSVPRFVWRRTFLGGALAFAHRAYALRPRPRWTLFGRRLLQNHPLLWASGIHHALWYPLGAACALSLLFCSFDSNRAGSISGACLLVAVLWPYVWLLIRRPDIAHVPTTSWRTIVGSFFLAAFPVALLCALGVAVALFNVEDVAAASVTICATVAHSTLFAIGIGVVRTYRSRLATSLSVLVGLCPAGFFVLMFAAFVCAALRRARPAVGTSRIQVEFATQFVLLAPVFSLLCIYTLMVVWSSRPELLLLVVAVAALLPLAYFFALGPAAKYLARANYEPQRE